MLRNFAQEERERQKTCLQKTEIPRGYALAAGYESHPGKECPFSGMWDMQGCSSWLERSPHLEGESRVPTGHKEWPENILQVSVNPTISEITLVRGLIYRKRKCTIRRNSAAFVFAACARKRLKLQ